MRLPDAASTCSDASWSASTAPALSWPSSSNRTFMGSEAAAEGRRELDRWRDYARAALQRTAALLHDVAVIRLRSQPWTIRRLGDSGLEVSPLCLGTMMFGDRTDAADVAAHHRRGARRRRQLHRHRRRLREGRVRAHRRPGDRRNRRALDPRDQGRQRDDQEAARRRLVAALDPARLRRQPRRGSAPTTSTSTTCTRTTPTRRSTRRSARSAI